jgi:tetratricopeptide (TPR) repeat protein
MLGGLTFVRLKAAENAFKDGRYDEAFQIVRDETLRDHRRAQKVLGRLAAAFLERAESHLDAQRFGEALLDLDRARDAGGDSGKIGEFRDRVRDQADRMQIKNRRRQERHAAARDQINRGSLYGAQAMLEPASDSDDHAKDLRDQAAARQRHADEVVGDARAFLKDGRLEPAIERCLRAKELDPRAPEVVKVESELCQQVLKQADAAMRDGRLDRASRDVALLGNLGERLPARLELEDVLACAREVSKAIGTGDVGQSVTLMQRLLRMAPNVKWIREAADQMDRAEAALRDIKGGPLGLTAEIRMPQALAEAVTMSMPQPGRAKKAQGPPVAKRVTGPLPSRLVLMVDGGGSFLILRKERVSIGRLGDNNGADLALLADLSNKHAEIARIEDDYFLFSTNDVSVNGRTVQQKLLADGDTIRLSRRAKLNFSVPSRRSNSAVLDLSEQVRTGDDVRRAVLFDKFAMLGPGSSCHMRVPLSANHFVVFEREGRLFIRPKGSGDGDSRHGADEAVELKLGQTIEIHGVSLVLETASSTGSLSA